MISYNQSYTHSFITTATILEENLPKQKRIKHYILTDYSRQTRDQITAQKYCVSSHPNNAYCEPRCSTTLIRKLLTQQHKNEKKSFTRKAGGQHRSDSLLQPQFCTTHLSLCYAEKKDETPTTLCLSHSITSGSFQQKFGLRMSDSYFTQMSIYIPPIS